MAKSLLSTATIGGRSCIGYERFDVIDPSTGSSFASAPLCGLEELENSIDAAEKAQPKWAESERLRRTALASCANSILRNRSELAKLITREQGKPLSEARSEVTYAAEVFKDYAEMEIPSRDLTSGGSVRTLLLNRPYGIVGLITPWNFPIGTIAVKLAPALLAGNSVILKPSPLAPLSPLFFGKTLNRILPSGVLNTLSGYKDLGELIARHPKIRKLSVTGSIPTGRAILSESANELKSVTLELGGNDPAIVLPDSDPQKIAGALLESAWRNAGQVCSAIKRVYVHESIHDQLVEAFTAEMANYTVGNGFVDGVRIGPLTTQESITRIDELVTSAYKSGAAILSYPRTNEDSGFFTTPKIVKGISPDHPLVTDEQFAPILPVVSYKTIEEAINWSNNSNYGLSASVWTANPRMGYDVAAQLECGRVGVNGHRRASAAAPFGGFKHSGLGRELGVWGLAEMCELQVVNIFE